MRSKGVWYGMHPHPLRGELSNFIIHSAVAVDEQEEGFEQLFSRKLGSNEFEICCVPCYSYKLSLGDVVKTAPYRGKSFVVDQVVKNSGHNTLRAWFGSTDDLRPDFSRDAAERELARPGISLEWCSDRLVGIDLTPEVDMKSLIAHLEDLQSTDVLKFEIGKMIEQN